MEWTVPAERERRGISVSAPDVRAALGEKGSVQLVDARAGEQFTGKGPLVNTRALGLDGGVYLALIFLSGSSGPHRFYGQKAEDTHHLSLPGNAPLWRFRRSTPFGARLILKLSLVLCLVLVPLPEQKIFIYFVYGVAGFRRGEACSPGGAHPRSSQHAVSRISGRGERA